MNHLITRALILVLATVACGDATVVLELEGATATARRRPADNPTGSQAVTPTAFAVKFVQAYVVEDVDPITMDNRGMVSRVWVHPDCPSDDGCADTDVSFVDLIDPVAANAAFASQARAIDVGTYRYVRFELCVGGPHGPNVRFEAGGAPARELTYGGCGLTSAALDPPLELAVGDAVTVRLDYDLSSGILYATGDSSCTATQPCLSSLAFTPRLGP
ncbi:MAG: hypothetical protein NT062_13520 [Proteobacteria bacterium]|nr:hypothetical protein [Pseudomonadota bacterium]